MELFNILQNVVEKFLEQFTKWAKTQDGILAVALVGSHARGAAKPDSDIDLVIITNKPEAYLKDNDWLKNFGEIEKFLDEDYRLVQSRRVFYKNGLEVEYGITTPEWTKVDPIHSGTQRVITDGAHILYDQSDILKKLYKALGVYL